MRLFLAILLNDAMRASLLRAQTQLKRGGVRGRFTPEENLHLTLAFIGEWSDPNAVLAAMETVPFSPFSLRLGGIGSFPGLLWAGVEENAALETYVRRLRRCLAEAGIPYDRKSFQAHITLVRRAAFQTPPALTLPEAGMTVRGVSLMRSDRGKTGMLYTELGRVPDG